VVTEAGKPVGTFLNSESAVLHARAGWQRNLTVNSLFAHSLSQNAQANLSGLGWRIIAQGDPHGVTRDSVLFSDAAANGHKAHVFIEANGRISSAQLAK
jgi:hypothetical protein